MRDNIDTLESVRDLIPKPKPVYEKRPRYVSKHKKRIQEETVTGKCAHRTLGVPYVELRPPTQFLKKKTRVECRKIVKHEHVKRPEFRRKLPSWTPIRASGSADLPALPRDPLSGRINFRKRNISNVKKLRPTEPKRKYVDTKCGETHDLEPSGLHPIYVYKKNFGKPPKFIVRDRRKLISSQESREESDARPADETKRSPYRYVSEEERKALLEGMKKKWDEMMQEFQRLPFLTDTPPKVLRKTKMERDLQDLEKDIDLVERHEHIYVYDD